MDIVATRVAYDSLTAGWVNERIALVPTMGALHEGHMALIRLARKRAERVVVSIFVNPSQFGPGEDWERYPRPLDDDLAVCRKLGVDIVFTPEVETMYPGGLGRETVVTPPPELTERLCGLSRLGHFTGVATVVLKLFQMLRPHAAIFGEKDAQQLAVIRAMVRDLHLPVEIIPHPTLREAGGLALSSRNRYLGTPEEQQAALHLYDTLSRIRAMVLASDRPLNARECMETCRLASLESLRSLNVSIEPIYLEAVDRETFLPVENLDQRAKVLMAAKVNGVRLIDNMDMSYTRSGI